MPVGAHASGGLGRGSDSLGNGETRIKPTACVSTEGGNHFRGPPERGWPEGPAMLRLPIIQHQAPPGTVDQRQSSPKSPTFMAGAARSCGVGCLSKQHHRGKTKIKKKIKPRAEKDLQRAPSPSTDSTHPTPSQGSSKAPGKDAAAAPVQLSTPLPCLREKVHRRSSFAWEQA